MSPSTSTRWSPTPEQLMILEEMYKGGVRTPNASQIQKITAHLSFYGKIEGKNVFYWFQNHKARERQKLRRKLSKQLQQQQQLLQDQLFLHQYQNPQNYNNFNVLSLIDPPPSASHHLSHDRPAEYLRDQQLGEADGTTAGMTNYTWKMDHHTPNLQESEDCMVRSPGDDWMMMTSMTKDSGPTTLPCCSNIRPLKTLELFPITAPSLKEHQIQGTTSKPSISSATSMN